MRPNVKIKSALLRQILTVSAVPILAGLVLRTAFAPLNLWYMAPVGFAFLFYAFKYGRRPGFSGLLFGAAFVLSLCSWILDTLLEQYQFSLPAALLFFLFIIGFFPAIPLAIWGFLFRFLPGNFGVEKSLLRKFAALIFMAAAFAVLEWLRSRYGLERGWAHLAGIYYRSPELLTLAAYTGGAGLSFLTVLAGGCIFLAFESRRNGLNRRALALLITVILTYGLFWTLGALRLNQQSENAAAPVQVALIHPAISQSERWRKNSSAEHLKIYSRLSLQAFPTPGLKPQDARRLLVWPETALTRSPNLDPGMEKAIKEIAKRTRAWLILGAPVPTPENPEIHYNSALIYSPLGQRIGRYDKIDLLPFAEQKVSYLSLMADHDGGPYRAGGKPRTVKLEPGNLSVGLAICFEAGVPTLFREYRRQGADIIVNISNDAWFGESSESEQQLALLALRAAETGLPALRATGYGMAGIIESTGRVRDRSSLSSSEVLTGQIRISRENHRFFFQIQPYFILLGFAYMCFYIIFVKKRKRQFESDNRGDSDE